MSDTEKPAKAEKALPTTLEEWREHHDAYVAKTKAWQAQVRDRDRGMRDQLQHATAMLREKDDALEVVAKDKHKLADAEADCAALRQAVTAAEAKVGHAVEEARASAAEALAEARAANDKLEARAHEAVALATERGAALTAAQRLTEGAAFLDPAPESVACARRIAARGAVEGAGDGTPAYCFLSTGSGDDRKHGWVPESRLVGTSWWAHWGTQLPMTDDDVAEAAKAAAVAAAIASEHERAAAAQSDAVAEGAAALAVNHRDALAKARAATDAADAKAAAAEAALQSAQREAAARLASELAAAMKEKDDAVHAAQAAGANAAVGLQRSVRELEAYKAKAKVALAALQAQVDAKTASAVEPAAQSPPPAPPAPHTTAAADEVTATATRTSDVTAPAVGNRERSAAAAEEELRAAVAEARASAAAVEAERWQGEVMSLSSELAGVRKQLDAAVRANREREKANGAASEASPKPTAVRAPDATPLHQVLLRAQSVPGANAPDKVHTRDVGCQAAPAVLMPAIPSSASGDSLTAVGTTTTTDAESAAAVKRKAARRQELLAMLGAELSPATPSVATAVVSSSAAEAPRERAPGEELPAAATHADASALDFGSLLSANDSGSGNTTRDDASAAEVARLRAELAAARKENSELRDDARDLSVSDERNRAQMVVLKDAIRELERAQGRAETAQQHGDYVKNIVVQFAQARGNPQVQRKLIPVLQTLLQLSSDERAAIEASF